MKALGLFACFLYTVLSFKLELSTRRWTSWLKPLLARSSSPKKSISDPTDDIVPSISAVNPTYKGFGRRPEPKSSMPSAMSTSMSASTSTLSKVEADIEDQDLDIKLPMVQPVIYTELKPLANGIIAEASLNPVLPTASVAARVEESVKDSKSIASNKVSEGSFISILFTQKKLVEQAEKTVSAGRDEVISSSADQRIAIPMSTVQPVAHSKPEPVETKVAIEASSPAVIAITQERAKGSSSDAPIVMSSSFISELYTRVKEIVVEQASNTAADVVSSPMIQLIVPPSEPEPVEAHLVVETLSTQLLSESPDTMMVEDEFDFFIDIPSDEDIELSITSEQGLNLISLDDAIAAMSSSDMETAILSEPELSDSIVIESLVNQAVPSDNVAAVEERVKESFIEASSSEVKVTSSAGLLNTDILVSPPVIQHMSSKLELDDRFTAVMASSSEAILVAAAVVENFQDSFVEAISEGSVVSSSANVLNTQEAIVKQVIKSAADSKELNFDDVSTNCLSEGGSWKISGYNIPESLAAGTSATSSGTNEKVIEVVKDVLSATAKKASLMLELSLVESSAKGVAELCDMLESANTKSLDWLDMWLIRSRRSFALASMLSENRDNYIKTVSFFGSRIPRNELPNVQNVPYPNYPSSSSLNPEGNFVNDCQLSNKVFRESLLDKVLLSIFRGIVRKEINWKSNTRGIKGLLEEGRHYMLSEEGTPANQHRFVKNSLAGLLTPVMPPFYRLFMSGIIPSKDNKDPEWLVSTFDSIRSSMPEGIQKRIQPGTQLGPLFYAPFLTSVVTPPFLSFLVGPSHVNLRQDGQLGGMVVEKCKFLQESNCKGLCLHQCKIPAQEFFAETLGMPLTVRPNFETQECQWSWGEVPLPAEQDPDFPTGCLSGCPTRSEISNSKLVEKATICSV
jgi:hypothetical protein